MDHVKEYLKMAGYSDLNIGNSPTIPKRKADARSDEIVAHYINSAGYGFPDANSSNNKLEETESDSNSVLPQANDVSFTTHSAPVRNVTWG